MDLRPFDPEYTELVAGWATTHQEVALLSGRDEYPFPAELLSTWRQADDDIRPYLYFDGEQPVGYAELWLDAEEDEVELARIILDPEVRGHGLGVALVRDLLGPARAAGFADIFLRVRPENVPALRTYHRAGFSLVPEAEAAEWNEDQPVAYTWMQYPTT